MAISSQVLKINLGLLTFRNLSLPFRQQQRSVRLVNFKEPERDSWIRLDGDIVRKDQEILRQKNLRFHPGLNVELRKDLSLYAMLAGKVFVTREKVDPRPENPIVERYYNEKDLKLYKFYYNVIPKTQEKKFKLVDLI